MHRVTVVRMCALAGLVLIAACYAPTLRDCAVACSAATDCTGGQVCGADGYCSSPDVAGQCAGILDAQPAGDGAMVNADAVPDADLCTAGCSAGTCIAGVCTIDCSAPDACPNEVVCPANLPCHVVCGGERACHSKVKCQLATSCQVTCSGFDSCDDEISCGTGPCTITCSGGLSCEKRLRCKDACSCDASCIGLGSCGEAPECPLGDTCRLGNGCTSTFPGCSSCP